MKIIITRLSRQRIICDHIRAYGPTYQGGNRQVEYRYIGQSEDSPSMSIAVWLRIGNETTLLKRIDDFLLSLDRMVYDLADDPFAEPMTAIERKKQEEEGY